MGEYMEERMQEQIEGGLCERDEMCKEIEDLTNVLAHVKYFLRNALADGYTLTELREIYKMVLEKSHGVDPK